MKRLPRHSSRGRLQRCSLPSNDLSSATSSGATG